MEISEGTPRDIVQEQTSTSSINKETIEAKSVFEQRARALYQKYNLSDAVPNLDQVIEIGSNFAEKYKVPEKFWEDDANLGIVLGCAEKLSENPHPFYKNRLENLMLRLVQPVTEKHLIDPAELWGAEAERGGLNEEDAKKYVLENMDPEATAEFLSKYFEEIARCKSEWAKKGYELKISANIVKDSVGNFKRKVGAGGYVHVPEKEEVKASKRANVQIVLLKGYSDNVDHLVKHELYHIEDYGNFFRRGYKEGIWESIDELHTEYAVGNYKQDRSEEDRCKPSYFELKEFWDRVTFTGDIGFNLLGDRQELLETVGRNFGFSGLTDFALLYAHSSGKIAVFETFFQNPMRPLIDMLVSREKILLRRAQIRGEAVGTTETLNNVAELARLMTPEEKNEENELYGLSFFEKYRHIAEMIPGSEPKVHVSGPTDQEFNYSISREKAKKLIISFSKTLALGELVSSGEMTTTPEIQQLFKGLEQIPFKRRDPNFDPKSHIEQQVQRTKEHSKEANERELYLEEVRSLFFGLTYDIEDSLDFSFSLNNAQTRKIILKDFHSELDKLGHFMADQKDAEVTRSFILGMYSFNLPYEVREEAATYLSGHFPELAGEIAARKAVFDSKKVFNLSF